MKITGTALKLGVFSLVLLLFTAIIIVVFGQIRFDRTNKYSAEFSSASGLRAGQFVRASGVEVGKVSKVRLVDGGQRVQVDFNVDRSLPLYQSTTAQIRYQDLIGNRYLELARGEGEGADRVLPAGGFIPLARTQPALDLDALIGGFKPLFRALDPDKVNNIAQSIITVFQGQGGTISDILDQTAQLTSALADRDQAIGEVITNLNTVLATTVKHQKEFDQTVDNFEVLITGLKNRADPIADATANISNAAGTLGDLLADNRPVLKDTIGHLETIAQPLVDQQAEVDDVLTKLPQAFKIIGRAGGLYGDFFNFYLCDLSLKLNGCTAGRAGPHREGVHPADGQVHAAMRTLEGSSRIRNGVVGIIILILVIGVGQSFASVPMLFAQPTYYGQFTDSGGLLVGDKVRIAGTDVGSIESLAIDGDHVVMGFSLGGNQIGTDSRLAIRTDTILGKKVLEVQPKGSTVLRASGVLPVGQSTTPYQIYDAFFDVTKAAAGWDIETVKDSLNVLSDTINQTYPNLSAALDGVARFSDTIGKRDEQFKQLLANANKVADRAGRPQRSDQRAAGECASTLLAAVNAARSGHRLPAGQRATGVGAVPGSGQRQSEPQPRARAVADRQRPSGQAQVRSGRRAGDAEQVHRLAGRGRRVGAVLQGVDRQPAARTGAAAVHRRGVQEARYRPRAVLAERGPAGVPIPRPQRAAAAQWCAAAGADRAGGHAGSSRARGAQGFAVLVHPAGRRPAIARQPAALRGPDGGPVRRQPIRTELRRRA